MSAQDDAIAIWQKKLNENTEVKYATLFSHLHFMQWTDLFLTTPMALIQHLCIVFLSQASKAQT